MSSTTEFAELHELIGGLRRCVTSLASRYGDSPAMRRASSTTSTASTSTPRNWNSPAGLPVTGTRAEKIAIPDTAVRHATSGETSMTRVSGVTAGAELGSIALPDATTPRG